MITESVDRTAWITCPATAPTEAVPTPHDYDDPNPEAGYHPRGNHHCTHEIPADGDHLGEHICACGTAFTAGPPQSILRPSAAPDTRFHPPTPESPAAAATARRAHGSGDPLHAALVDALTVVAGDTLVVRIASDRQAEKDALRRDLQRVLPDGVDVVVVAADQVCVLERFRP